MVDISARQTSQSIKAFWGNASRWTVRDPSPRVAEVKHLFLSKSRTVQREAHPCHRIASSAASIRLYRLPGRPAKPLQGPKREQCVGRGFRERCSLTHICTSVSDGSHWCCAGNAPPKVRLITQGPTSASKSKSLAGGASPGRLFLNPLGSCEVSSRRTVSVSFSSSQPFSWLP